MLCIHITANFQLDCVPYITNEHASQCDIRIEIYLTGRRLTPELKTDRAKLAEYAALATRPNYRRWKCFLDSIQPGVGEMRSCSKVHSAKINIPLHPTRDFCLFIINLLPGKESIQLLPAPCRYSISPQTL